MSVVNLVSVLLVAALINPLFFPPPHAAAATSPTVKSPTKISSPR